jgi:hypothetical protein
MNPSRKFPFAACVVAFFVVLSAGATSARAEDEDVEHEARLIGLGQEPKSMILSSGASMAYMSLLLGGLICVGVLFKNANRSHLD